MLNGFGQSDFKDLTLAFLTSVLHNYARKWQISIALWSFYTTTAMQFPVLTKTDREVIQITVNGFANKSRLSYRFYVEIRRKLCVGRRGCDLQTKNLWRKENWRCILGDQSQISLSKSVQSQTWLTSCHLDTFAGIIAVKPFCENGEIVPVLDLHKTLINVHSFTRCFKEIPLIILTNF